MRDLVSWVVSGGRVVEGCCCCCCVPFIDTGAAGFETGVVAASWVREESENSRMICCARLFSFCSDGVMRSVRSVLRTLIRLKCSPSSSRPEALKSARSVCRVYAAWTRAAWLSATGAGFVVLTTPVAAVIASAISLSRLRPSSKARATDRPILTVTQSLLAANLTSSATAWRSMTSRSSRW